MTCSKCHNQKPELPSGVLEIIQNEAPVLFHKVLFPASIGDDETNPPYTLNYKNVLLQYEANNHVYLYSSDGAATQLPTGETDLTAIKETLAEHGIQIEDLQQTTEQIQAHITSLDNDITNLNSDIVIINSELASTNAAVEANATSIATVNNKVTNVTNLANQTKEELDGLSTIVSNQADELSTAQGDIEELQATTSANTTNIASNTSAIATLTSDMATVKDDIAANTQNIDQNTSAIDAIKTGLNVYVEKETEFNGNDSTLDVVHTKINLKDSTTQETTDALPVASETSAGIMNASTFSAVQQNSENVDSILNGAVALTGLPESPTQTGLTDQWKTATGKTELINRADIYDVTNEKRWTYYENTGTWYSASTNGGTIEINQATNDSLGIVMGSTDPGQIFVEPNGRMSVNNWDEHQQDITNLQNLTSEQGELLNTTAAQLEETQKDANDALADISAIQADYVSKTKVVDNYSTATDEINSAAFINKKFRGIAVNIGSGTHLDPANNDYSISIGNSANSRNYGSQDGNIAIGRSASAGSTSTAQQAIAIGYNAVASTSKGVAIGFQSVTSRSDEFSIGQTNATRYLANVTAGVLDTDAVNVKQMQDYVAEHTPSGAATGIPAFEGTPTNYVLNLESTDFGTEPELGQMVAIGIPSGTAVLRYITLNDGDQYPIYTNGVTTSGSNSTSIGVNLRTGLLIVCIFCGTQWRAVNVGKTIGTSDISNGAVTIDKIASSSIMTVDEFNAAWEAA